MKVENNEYAKFIRRIIKAMGKRTGNGDIESLRELARLHDEVDAEIDRRIAELHGEPWNYSYAQIADRLGVTRAAVSKRMANR